jgi:O-antigen ligase
MKNKPPSKPAPPLKKSRQNLKPSFYLLMLAYPLVPVLVPNFDSFDSNGPKFLALAILNLAAFAVLFADADYRNRPEVRLRFFRNYIGIAYALFLVISLLSFFNAINLVESLLNMIKTLTIFASAYVLYVIFTSNRGYLLHLAVALSILLLLDSLTVFYNMVLYVSREVTSIMDIKTVYSHKNILSSALFVKLPAAMYLMFFTTRWHKWLGYIAALSAVLATLLLSARAFYLGLALMLISLFIYAWMRQHASGRKGYIRTIAIIAGAFVLAILLYSAAQRMLFPKNTDTIWNTGIVSRLSSISSGESSTNARLSSWKRSVKLIGDHPILGVGTGNWKIAVLKYENQQAPDFLYMYKNHNDFLEVTAETGLLGGMAFISLFFLILASFTRASLKSETDDDRIKMLFLPAFGILAYSVDAFFNFPADRPEIQALFAVYVALGAANPGMEIPDRKVSTITTEKVRFIDDHTRQVSLLGVAGILFFSAWILYLNVKSLHYQLLVRKDNLSQTYSHPADFILKGFPFIPTVSSHGEPITVEKAQYLINENRLPEAISLLMADESSPYDSRREYYITKAYYMAGMKDSALAWGYKAYHLKPFHDNMVRALALWLFEKGRHQESQKILSAYLKQIKTNPVIWNLAAEQLHALGYTHQAITLLDSASKYLPTHQSIVTKRDQLKME